MNGLEFARCTTAGGFRRVLIHAAPAQAHVEICDENHDVKFVRDWPSIQAWWLQRLGVNLVRHPEFKQYTPDEDPYFKMFLKKA